MTNSFMAFLTESEAATNQAGPAVATNPVPITDKSVKRKDTIVGLVEDHNNSDDTDITPLESPYIQGMFGNICQFTIPHREYEKIKHGRQKYSAWSQFIEDPDFRQRVQKVMYQKGAVMLTSDTAGASVVLRHLRNQRLKAAEELALGGESYNEFESDVQYVDMINESTTLDIPINEEYDPDEMNLYDPAYDYAMDVLHYNENDSDLFASLVEAYFYVIDDALETEDYYFEMSDIKGFIQSAIELVEEEQQEFGLFDTVSDVMKGQLLAYLTENFDYSDYLDENED